MLATAPRHRNPRRSRIRWFSLAMGLAGLASPAAAQSKSARQRASDATPMCVLGEVSQSRPALDDTTLLYVEPASVLEDNGDLLVLGQPTYVARLTRDRRFRHQSRDSLFGALRVGKSRWLTIPSPAPGRYFTEPRAARRNRNQWDVVFLELPAPLDPQTTDSSIGLWHAELHGNRWGAMQRIPVPDSIQPNILSFTRLLRHGDTLTFGMHVGINRARAVDGSMVVQRVGDRWSWRLLRETDTWLAFQTDARGRSRILRSMWDLTDISAAYEGLWLIEDARNQKVLDFAPARGIGHATAATSGRDGFLLTYTKPFDQDDRRWYAMELGTGRRVRRSLVLDSAYSKVTVLRGFADSPGPLWLADHRLPDSTKNHLDLLTFDRGVVRTLASVANEFAGASPAILTDRGSILIVGPVFAKTASGPVLETLAVTIGLQCRVTTAPERTRRNPRR